MSCSTNHNRASITLEETDALPKEQGRVRFTAIVGFADKEPSLEQFEYSSDPCQSPEVERPLVPDDWRPTDVEVFQLP